LIAAGIRAEVDGRSDKINFKIREAQLQKIPYMLVVGDREAQAGQVAVRNRKQGDQGAVGVDEFLSRLSRLVTTRSLEE
jgi:threonyl-tRNA synthetase